MDGAGSEDGLRVWEGLSPAQAQGLACVVCGRDYLQEAVVRVPVGRTEVGWQVFACVRAGPVEIPDDALTAAGAAYLEALEQATAAAGGDARYADPDEAATVAGAAPVVVAGELRLLAREMAGYVGVVQGWRGCSEGVRWLRERADVLDPSGRGER